MKEKVSNEQYDVTFRKAIEVLQWYNFIRSSGTQ